MASTALLRRGDDKALKAKSFSSSSASLNKRRPFVVVFSLSSLFYSILVVSLLLLCPSGLNDGRMMMSSSSHLSSSSVSFLYNNAPSSSVFFLSSSNTSSSFAFRFPSAIRMAEASFWRRRSESLFCGEESCYNLLGLQVGSHPSNIRKAFRQMKEKLAATVADSDTSISEEEKEKRRREGKEGEGAAQEEMQQQRLFMSEEEKEARRLKVEMAFGVLKNSRVRAAYDAFLNDPDGLLTFLSSLRRCYERLISVVSALLLILVFASIAQVVHNNTNQASKLRALKNSDQIQKNARRIAEERHGSKIRRLPPKEEEKLREQIVGELANEWAKENKELLPDLQTSDLVVVRFFLLPWNLLACLHFYLRWFWLFGVCKAEYGHEEKTYLTRKALKMSEVEWAALDSSDVEHFLSLKLWEKERLQKYQEETAEKERESRLQSGKYRQQKRRARKGITPFNYNDD